MTTPRVGIIGTGMIAAAHASALGRSPALTLGGVHDVNPAAGEAFARTHGATVEPDLDHLLAGNDAVIICTPNQTHVPLADQVLAAGKPLLLEKPMALSGDDAERLRRGFAEAGLPLLVGHTHRHSDYGRTVHQVISSGALGRVKQVRIAITGGWIWGGWQAWVLDEQKSGGHAFHNGVHLYDLAHWWLDSPVVEAIGVGQRLTSAALEFDDYLVATLTTESGATAVCEISRGEKPVSTSLFEIVVHGDQGTLRRQWNSEGWVSFTEAAAGPRPIPTSDPFARQLDVFARAIASEPYSPDPADAVHATRIAEAVARSAAAGLVEPVEVAR
ncbi:Gfo/Idh/MocA family protein [Aestuariimicrobium soli]|uniref:Gfo/Idh/MocA family protein n=1 Tax=Aestuariimicrobium soli TaxID=2035834 RepID=UPI003EBE6439